MRREKDFSFEEFPFENITCKVNLKAIFLVRINYFSSHQFVNADCREGRNFYSRAGLKLESRAAQE